ncbi:MAG: DNA polymerase I [Gammaproteobacteria bacterium]|nr:DNA polymerase I [Gammaproteobacteria bacterium]
MQHSLLILVDGSSYLFRAYHAMPNFTNSKGEHTGAIFGVVNMVKRLMRDYPDADIVMVFDAKGKTFRNDLYTEYKAHRPPMPEDLRAQIMPLHEILEAMGLPLIVTPGVEADDVIGTLATQASERKQNVIISTGDKDLAQLVDEHVTLINTMTETLMDSNGVKEKFGVPPDRIVDYLALIGDTSDNIPGIPKVGPKTAVKWLETYGDLDGVICHAEEIKGKVGENLRNNLPILELSRTLVTIKCDVDLNLKAADFKLKAPNKDTLVEFFKQYEFKSWLAELVGKTNQNEKSTKTTNVIDTSQYETILSEKQWHQWIEKLKLADVFVFDLETTSLNYIEAEIVGIAVAFVDHAACYIPLAHDYENVPKQLERDDILSQLKPILENDKIAKIGQNLKYDMSVLANYDISLKGVAFDTMLESYVIDSVATRHDMDSLSLKYLAHKTIHFEDIAGKGVKQITFNQIDIETAAEYAAEDADVTLRLHEVLWCELSKTASLIEVFEKIEMPLVPVLSSIERNGVLVNGQFLNKQSEQLAKRIDEIEQEAFTLAGQSFNLASPKQIQEILFEKQNLPVLKKTPKGQPSTAENVLQELAQDYELPAKILEHRGLSKLKSTYTDKLPLQINEKTGRVHTSYHQAVAATGRLSSSDPNLQNIPVRTEAGRRIRQAFIAPENRVIVAADYSQIELRIMAHLSSDQSLVKAFSAGEDIHRATAAEILGVEPADVNSEQRRHAKAINFGLIYGMSAFGLARQLDIERGQAQQYMDHYFERYPGVKTYMEKTREQAKEQGYVETLFGRRLYLPDINSSNGMRRQYAERTAINAPMQGTAADIIKLAMIDIHAWLSTSHMQSKMIMQVHDELVFEVPENELGSLKTGVKSHMEAAAKLDVPLIVDIGVGQNWDEAH